MEARAKLFGHPIHQMLIVFPLGLLATAVVFDIIYLATGTLGWWAVAYYLIAAGILGGLLAAPFGLVDWLKIPKGTRARRIGALHGLGNVAVLALFVTSWLMRHYAPFDLGRVAIVFSVAGALLALVTGWLGGELIDRLGIGVSPGANADAPSSFRGQPAVEEPEPFMPGEPDAGRPSVA